MTRPTTPDTTNPVVTAGASPDPTGHADDDAAASHSPGATQALDAQQRAALEAERDFLLASLRDLDAEHAAGELDDAQHEALTSRYSARAARILRALDTAGDDSTGTPDASQTPTSQRPERVASPGDCARAVGRCRGGGRGGAALGAVGP